MNKEELIGKLTVKLNETGQLSHWEPQDIREFIEKVVEKYSSKIEAAIDGGMTTDQVVEQILFNKAISALREWMYDNVKSVITD